MPTSSNPGFASKLGTSLRQILGGGMMAAGHHLGGPSQKDMASIQALQERQNLEKQRYEQEKQYRARQEARQNEQDVINRDKNQRRQDLLTEFAKELEKGGITADSLLKHGTSALMVDEQALGMNLLGMANKRLDSKNKAEALAKYNQWVRETYSSMKALPPDAPLSGTITALQNDPEARDRARAKSIYDRDRQRIKDEFEDAKAKREAILGEQAIALGKQKIKDIPISTEKKQLDIAQQKKTLAKPYPTDTKTTRLTKSLPDVDRLIESMQRIEKDLLVKFQYGVEDSPLVDGRLPKSRIKNYLELYRIQISNIYDRAVKEKDTQAQNAARDALSIFKQIYTNAPEG